MLRASRGKNTEGTEIRGRRGREEEEEEENKRAREEERKRDCALRSE
jgi:hypothetical protein